MCQEGKFLGWEMVFVGELECQGDQAGGCGRWKGLDVDL